MRWGTCSTWAKVRNTLTVHINAPADRVFDFCADFATHAPVMSPGIEVTEVSPGPIGVGTEFRYVHPAGLKGRSEIVEYAPPHSDRLRFGAIHDGDQGRTRRGRIDTADRKRRQTGNTDPLDTAVPVDVRTVAAQAYGRREPPIRAVGPDNLGRLTP